MSLAVAKTGRNSSPIAALFAMAWPRVFWDVPTQITVATMIAASAEAMRDDRVLNSERIARAIITAKQEGICMSRSPTAALRKNPTLELLRPQTNCTAPCICCRMALQPAVLALLKVDHYEEPAEVSD